MTTTQPYHARAFEEGNAFEYLTEVCTGAHVLVMNGVTPGLNYGYVGYCANCGMAAWEVTQ